MALTEFDDFSSPYKPLAISQSNGGYILTQDGRVLKVERSEVTTISGLTGILAIASDANGDLFAVGGSERALFSYSNQFKELAPFPVALPTSPNLRVYIAVDKSQVAISWNDLENDRSLSRNLIPLWRFEHERWTNLSE